MAERAARPGSQDELPQQDERVARAAFTALGVPPQPCSIDYYDDGMARVTLLADGRSIEVPA